MISKCNFKVPTRGRTTSKFVQPWRIVHGFSRYKPRSLCNKMGENDEDIGDEVAVRYKGANRRYKGRKPSHRVDCWHSEGSTRRTSASSGILWHIFAWIRHHQGCIILQAIGIWTRYRPTSVMKGEDECCVESRSALW